MNRNQIKRYQRSETLLVAALLAVAGGFLDAYTYLCRGGVFANAQTGNMALLGVHLAKGEWASAGAYFIPVFSFFCGVLITEVIKHHPLRRGRLHWRQLVVLLEIVILVAASFIPCGDLNNVVNIMVSFVCALQVESFRKVRGNPFASTMCTGNLRSGTEALYHGIREHEGAKVEKSLCYYAIIFCFICGSAAGGILSRLDPQHAVLAAPALQCVAFGIMCLEEEQEEEERREKAR